MKKKIVAVVAIVALIAILGVCLVACNQSDYKKRLDKAGYNVSTQSAEELGVDDSKIEWAVQGVKPGEGWLSLPETVSVVKFKKTDDAKAFESDMKKLTEKVGGAVKRSGNIVIAGTEQGVKDAQ